MATEFADGVKDYIDRSLQHLWIHTIQQDELNQDDALLVIKSGEGIYLTDSKDRQYIDLMSGLWVVAVGHGRQRLADVASEQIQGTTQSFMTLFQQVVTLPAPMLAGYIVSQFGYSTVFYYSSALLFSAATVWTFIQIPKRAGTSNAG